MLEGVAKESLRDILTIANKHRTIAAALEAAVSKCLDQGSIEGLYEMVAYSFNANQHQPAYGGGGSLPPGSYKGVIVESSQENVEKNGQVVGGYLALQITPIEGPLKGQKMTDRLNLHHTNPKTVEIANKQLSAYCHVLGKFQINDTAELHNIPFMFEVNWQKGQEPSEANPNGGYTEIKKIMDINGNEPGKSGNNNSGNVNQNQNVNIPDQAAGGVTAQGGGWGGQQNGGQQQQPDNNQQGNQNNGGQNGGGWGGAQQGNQQGGNAGWGQQQPDNSGQQNGGGNGGGWGGQNNNGQQGGGWQQGGNGGQPAWGQR
jgi:hypothetical protein